MIIPSVRYFRLYDTSVCMVVPPVGFMNIVMIPIGRSGFVSYHQLYSIGIEVIGDLFKIYSLHLRHIIQYLNPTTYI